MQKSLPLRKRFPTNDKAILRSLDLYTESCSVTAPSDAAEFMQSWLKGSFGDPTFTLKKSEDATEIHWADASEGMKAEVILLTRMPDKKFALLSVIKHMKASMRS
jgi:hypothetical protein